MLLTALLGGCARRETNARDAADANDAGRWLAASGEGERALLGRLSTLPSGTEQRMGDSVVVAEAPYDAASGRTCRALHVASPQTHVKSHRLACRKGNAWFFVPDVFGANSVQ